MMSNDKKLHWIPAATALAWMLLAALPAAAQSGPPDAGPQAMPPAAAGQDRSATGAAPAPAPASQGVFSPAQPAAEASSAATAPVARATADRDAPAGLFPAIKAFGAAGMLLSLFLVGFLLLRKCAPRYFARRPAQKSLRLVENLSMGEKRSIAVIDVAGRVFLVGNTPHQITLLASLGDDHFRQAEETAPARAASGGGRGRFVNLLMSQKSRTAPEPAGAGTLPPDLRGKMRQLRAALEG